MGFHFQLILKQLHVNTSTTLYVKENSFAVVLQRLSRTFENNVPGKERKNLTS